MLLLPFLTQVCFSMEQEGTLELFEKFADQKIFNDEQKKTYFKTEYKKLFEEKKITDVKDWFTKIKAFHNDGEQAFLYDSIRAANVFLERTNSMNEFEEICKCKNKSKFDFKLVSNSFQEYDNNYEKIDDYYDGNNESYKGGFGDVAKKLSSISFEDQAEKMDKKQAFFMQHNIDYQNLFVTFENSKNHTERNNACRYLCYLDQVYYCSNQPCDVNLPNRYQELLGESFYDICNQAATIKSLVDSDLASDFFDVLSHSIQRRPYTDFTGTLDNFLRLNQNVRDCKPGHLVQHFKQSNEKKDAQPLENKPNPYEEKMDETIHLISPTIDQLLKDEDCAHLLSKYQKEFFPETTMDRLKDELEPFVTDANLMNIKSDEDRFAYFILIQMLHSYEKNESKADNEFKKIYKNLTKLMHPDKYENSAKKEVATNLTKLLTTFKDDLGSQEDIGSKKACIINFFNDLRETIAVFQCVPFADYAHAMNSFYDLKETKTQLSKFNAYLHHEYAISYSKQHRDRELKLLNTLSIEKRKLIKELHIMYVKKATKPIDFEAWYQYINTIPIDKDKKFAEAFNLLLTNYSKTELPAFIKRFKRNYHTHKQHDLLLFEAYTNFNTDCVENNLKQIDFFDWKPVFKDLMKNHQFNLTNSGDIKLNNALTKLYFHKPDSFAQAEDFIATIKNQRNFNKKEASIRIGNFLKVATLLNDKKSSYEEYEVCHKKVSHYFTKQLFFKELNDDDQEKTLNEMTQTMFLSSKFSLKSDFEEAIPELPDNNAYLSLAGSYYNQIRNLKFSKLKKYKRYTFTDFVNEIKTINTLFSGCFSNRISEHLSEEIQTLRHNFIVSLAFARINGLSDADFNAVKESVKNVKTNESEARCYLTLVTDILNETHLNFGKSDIFHRFSKLFEDAREKKIFATVFSAEPPLDATATAQQNKAFEDSIEQFKKEEHVFYETMLPETYKNQIEKLLKKQALNQIEMQKAKKAAFSAACVARVIGQSTGRLEPAVWQEFVESMSQTESTDSEAEQANENRFASGIPAHGNRTDFDFIDTLALTYQTFLLGYGGKKAYTYLKNTTLEDVKDRVKPFYMQQNVDRGLCTPANLALLAFLNRLCPYVSKEDFENEDMEKHAKKAYGLLRFYETYASKKGLYTAFEENKDQLFNKIVQHPAIFQHTVHHRNMMQNLSIELYSTKIKTLNSVGTPAFYINRCLHNAFNRLL